MLARFLLTDLIASFDIENIYKAQMVFAVTGLCFAAYQIFEQA